MAEFVPQLVRVRANVSQTGFGSGSGPVSNGTQKKIIFGLTTPSLLIRPPKIAIWIYQGGDIGSRPGGPGRPKSCGTFPGEVAAKWGSVVCAAAALDAAVSVIYAASGEVTLGHAISRSLNAAFLFPLYAFTCRNSVVRIKNLCVAKGSSTPNKMLSPLYTLFCKFTTLQC